MNQEDIELLKKSIDQTVRLLCMDGEIVIAKIDSVDVDDEEIVYEMLHTTNTSRYEKYDRQPAYLIRFKDIERVESTQNR